MKKTFVTISIASVFMLTACNESAETTQSTAQSTAPTATQEVEAQAVETQESAETQAAKAELGSFGVELDARDESIKPGDDFFQYAGGTWYNNFEMPGDKTRYGAFDRLAERSETQIKAIIEEISTGENLNAEQQLIKDFYSAYMDTEAANAKGLSPIAPILQKIEQISDKTQLTAAFGSAWLDGSSSPIAGGMWFNRLDPDQYQMSISVSGIGLPDRSYYLEDTERFINIRKEYVAYIQQVLDMAGIENSAEKAQQILALETEIAQAQWPREKRRDREIRRRRDEERLRRDECRVTMASEHASMYRVHCLTSC